MSLFIDTAHGGRPKDQPLDSIETRISRAEQHLGIQTRRQRLLETMLYVDGPFLETAIISGQPTNPERLFGDEKWEGYLNGRLLARAYGKKTLTIDFITSIHKELLKSTHPEATTSFTTSENPRGGDAILGMYLPLTLNDQKVRAIESNPYLHWQPVKIGLLPSGYIGYSVKTREERVEELQKICNWYNAERSNGDLNPYALAARLQHRFVSLHPLAVDYNGTVSRILMNWSLENDHLPPSALHDFDDDIFTDEISWGKAVKAGSARYARAKSRASSESDDIAEMLDLDEAYAFYQRHASHLYPPPHLVPGEQHIRGSAFVDGFLISLTRVMKDYGPRYTCCANDNPQTGQ